MNKITTNDIRFGSNGDGAKGLANAYLDCIMV